ncbi:MAG: hypothetical protein ACD_75C02029G0002 [uncultured bacterium]|nr:MAG: hypothetical protein ACD_75C02029G0002 [uncultured bacterium]
MLIDWFTVIAQVVNFLILVWLMKRFLYTPILNAIDAREQRIAASLAKAMARQGEAQRQQDEYREKNEEFERQRIALLRSAELEARKELQRLLKEAHKAHEELWSRQQETLQSDFQNLKDEIRRRVRVEVFAIARKTLTDLAAESLEERMVEAFIRHCRALGEVERRELRTVFDTPAGPAQVRSTFPMPAALQQDLESAIREIFACTDQLHFETSPDLVSGIALSVSGHEIAWSIADYLQALEESVAEVLHVRPPVKERAESKSEHGAGDHG